MGRATFFHISDGRNQLQVYLRGDKVGQETYERFSLFDIGDIIAVKGVLFKTRTEELTVLAESTVFLAKCRHPLPEKWHGLQDVELRYRKRYLDCKSGNYGYLQTAQCFDIRHPQIFR